jgi:Holliday junction DNA helicase RuvB
MAKHAADPPDPTPQTIDHFIGQGQVIEPVKVALEATWSTNQRLPHMLFCGPAGLGKTELAKIIAREMGTKLTEALGQNLRSGAAMAGFLLGCRDGDVLFIDEIQELRPEPQTQLFRAMTDRTVFLSGGPFGPNVTPTSVANFTLLAATTHECELSKPLRDRFEMVLRFTFYSSAELVQILSRRNPHPGPPAEPAVLEAIAQRSRVTPRIALRILGACRRMARSLGLRTITMEQFAETCRIERIDELGLDETERSYLRILARSSAPVRVNTLAAKLGLPVKTVQKVTEEFLIRADLVDCTPIGRVLTDRGWAHVRRLEVVNRRNAIDEAGTVP